MATMNISLPDKMKQWVEAQVESGRFANASDFIRDIIRNEMDREQAMEDFDRIVEQAIASGVSDKSMDEIRDEARAMAEEALKQRA